MAHHNQPTSTSPLLPPRSLGFGAAQLGNLYHELSDEQAQEAVEAAWDAGIRYFDTAPHYGLGLSERRLGQALARHPRDAYVISTKVGRLLRPNPHPTGRDLDNGFLVPDTLRRIRDYSAEGIRASLEESRDRLGLDHIDIALIHDPDEEPNMTTQALAEAVPELEHLRSQGEISAWGVGTKDTTTAKQFVEEANPDYLMLAGRFTLLETNRSLVDLCARNRVPIIAVGVFNSGLLSKEIPTTQSHYEYAKAPHALVERAQRIAEACQEFNVTLPQAAIAFPFTAAAVQAVCLGMGTADHVNRNAQLFAQPTPPELFTHLVHLGLMDGAH